MKKLLAFILAAVMTASLCACGSSKGGAEGSTSAKGSSAAGEAVAASDIKVGCIMIGDENEGYTEAHLKAVEEMKKNLGLSDDQVVIKTNIKEDEGCYDAAVDLAEQGCNIVIANSFGHESYIIRTYSSVMQQDIRQRAADFLTCITSLPESMNPVIYPVLLLV